MLLACALRPLVVGHPNRGNGRGVFIALLAGFKVKQPFIHSVWSEGGRLVLADCHGSPLAASEHSGHWATQNTQVRSFVR